MALNFNQSFIYYGNEQIALKCPEFGCRADQTSDRIRLQLDGDSRNVQRYSELFTALLEERTTFTVRHVDILSINGVELSKEKALNCVEQ